MSLNWDVSKIEGYKKLCWISDGKGGVKLNPVTDCLVWGTMIVGIGRITEKTADEFYFRLKLNQRLGRSHYMDANGEPYCPTLEDIKAHIGLSTNVFPMETRAKYLKRIMDAEVRECEWAIRDEKQRGPDMQVTVLNKWYTVVAFNTDYCAADPAEDTSDRDAEWIEAKDAKEAEEKYMEACLKNGDGSMQIAGTFEGKLTAAR